MEVLRVYPQFIYLTAYIYASITGRMNPLFCAIDTTDFDKAKRLIGVVSPYVGGIKLGLEFFTHHGSEGVKRVMPEGLPLFLDLKFYDIPNTVAGAVRALKGLNISMFTLHASGGVSMMRAARDAAANLPTNPKVLGVTVLTSFEEKDMESLGIQLSIAKQVEKLAELAADVGLHGAVCSPHEISLLRGKLGGGFSLVVPGIRPAGSEAGDQKRIMTPKEALDLGASYLVIGRPITGAENPAKAAEAIFKTL
jgi:orotidine-5'-phosphate decarboxylase